MKYSIDGYSTENASKRVYTGRLLPPPRRRRHGLLKSVILVAVVIAAGQFFFSGCLVTRADRAALRNPDTGILLGAEPRDLGNINASAGVLFVHGFVGCGNNFANLPDRIAAKGLHARVILLPGHGTSPRDLHAITPDTLVDAVERELAEMKRLHRRVYVVGHSMGGALATIAVSEQGAEALVLVAPYFGVTHRWWYGLRPEQWSRLTAPIVPWLYKGKLFLQVNKKESKDSIVSYVWFPSRAAVMLADIGDRANRSTVLDRVTCPVMLLHSENDVAASFERATAAVDTMRPRYIEKIVYTASNHHLLWDYDGEDAANQIVRFIEQVELQVAPTAPQPLPIMEPAAADTPEPDQTSVEDVSKPDLSVE